MKEIQLPTPVTPEDFLFKIIDPALELLPSKLNSIKARVLMLAFAMQESELHYRRQMVGNPPRPTGPAKSFWQAEQGGGMVHGVRVFKGGGVAEMADSVYHKRGLFNDPMQVASKDSIIWNAIEQDDILAAALARLLIYTHPNPLPEDNEVYNAWMYYLKTWRPGAYERGTQSQRNDLWRKFKVNHGRAVDAVSRAYA